MRFAQINSVIKTKLIPTIEEVFGASGILSSDVWCKLHPCPSQNKQCAALPHALLLVSVHPRIISIP